jgi:protein-L-isoaspartate(D-aspartate) O-methyltransferase
MLPKTTGMAYEEEREEMVAGLLRRGHIEQDATAEALRSVPRHEFVPEDKRGRAYHDRPLPIGEGQTISAPHMVGTMVEELDLSPGDEVLEIGTGCGYHAAVTAEVVGPGNVYSVEYVPELADRARATLERLGYEVSVRSGDGHEGWPEYAPYDAAYLTCAADEIPPALIEQVRTGGYVLGPIGGVRQELVRVTVTAEGTERETLGGVRFVRMQG